MSDGFSCQPGLHWRHSRHVCCLTQQTCLLYRTAESPKSNYCNGTMLWNQDKVNIMQRLYPPVKTEHDHMFGHLWSHNALALRVANRAVCIRSTLFEHKQSKSDIDHTCKHTRAWQGTRRPYIAPNMQTLQAISSAKSSEPKQSCAQQSQAKLNTARQSHAKLRKDCEQGQMRNIKKFSQLESS